MDCISIKELIWARWGGGWVGCHGTCVSQFLMLDTKFTRGGGQLSFQLPQWENAYFLNEKIIFPWIKWYFVLCVDSSNSGGFGGRGGFGRHERFNEPSRGLCAWIKTGTVTSAVSWLSGNYFQKKAQIKSSRANRLGRHQILTYSLHCGLPAR